MSWALVDALRQRFPDVEPFPHEEAQETRDAAAEGHTPPARGHGPAPFAHRVPGAWVPASRLLEVARVLRDDAPFHLDYCSFVSAVDWPEQGSLEVVYHLFSMAARHELLIKVKVPRDDARLPSVTGLWNAANWHERETYDLFGIAFEGHPDLRRIMMTEDWQGHPLRKDYVYEEPRWLVDLAAQRQREIEGLGLGERA
jgi:NADH/F420H2 dehydrogenase subunit C